MRVILVTHGFRLSIRTASTLNAVHPSSCGQVHPFSCGLDAHLSCFQVLSAHFRAYIQALEKLQQDLATSSDLIGVETSSPSLFSTRRETLKNRSSVFAVGERLNILKVFL